MCRCSEMGCKVCRGLCYINFFFYPASLEAWVFFPWKEWYNISGVSVKKVMQFSQENLITPWKCRPHNCCMCTLYWQLLICTVSHPGTLPSCCSYSPSPLFLPPVSWTPLQTASCSSLEGLSWSEPIKLQWEAAWRKHGCSVALLSVNCMIPVPDSGGPISYSNSAADLWPHVCHSQTHKLALHTRTHTQ